MIDNAEYKILLYKYEELKKENRQLQEELAYFDIGKILVGANPAVSDADAESPNKVYDSIKKRYK
jgi:cell division septum initiation protein DivIVA